MGPHAKTADFSEGGKITPAARLVEITREISRRREAVIVGRLCTANSVSSPVGCGLTREGCGWKKKGKEGNGQKASQLPDRFEAGNEYRGGSDEPEEENRSERDHDACRGDKATSPSADRIEACNQSLFLGPVSPPRRSNGKPFSAGLGLSAALF